MVSERTIHSILRSYWGYDAFRPMQEDVINSILTHHDTLALMPTGGGKSICYQVPAMMMQGICLVISPLIALMKDQVEQLRKRNITAFSIHSGMSRKEVIRTLEIAGSSNCKFLYVSPERLESKLFKEYLPGLNVSLIAVDEAHCISQWGYDFRPPYLRIANLREDLRDVTVLALTASATPEVQEDICTKLAFTNQQVFRQSFERPNLSYSVFEADAKIHRIIDIINKVPGSGIVYCKSRKRTKEISELLKSNGISADHYHAGLVQEERNRKQEQWINNQVRIIVCTNAFGMGIDKPNVRIVIHADVPDTLENYYQEAGRAGRDGKNAYAVLLYDKKELIELKENVASRFPELNEIRTVYQALANYLQVPAQSAANDYFDFDLLDFVKKFKLDAKMVMNALKVLEQEEWVAFNEQVFSSSTLEFTIGKKALHQFEDEHASLEPIIKTLLRTYEGIYDYPVAISEKYLAILCRLEEDKLKAQLIQLDKMRIVAYHPKKEKPQLQFLRSRVKAEDLSLNLAAINARKKIYEEKLGKIISYVGNADDCRSQFIANYFGDKKTRPCGICDNCLAKKAKSLSTAEFVELHKQIISILQAGSLKPSELLSQLMVKKEKAWEAIEFLQAEGKIGMDVMGEIFLARSLNK